MDDFYALPVLQAFFAFLRMFSSAFAVSQEVSISFDSSVISVSLVFLQI
jgi:hypothetical protein